MKKLRWKFIGFASLSVTILLVLILGTINLVNFGLVASKADQITQAIADRGGSFNEGGGPNFNPPSQESNPGQASPQEGEESRPARPDDIASPDMVESMRYYTVKFDASGNPSFIDERISFLDATTRLNIASEAYKSGHNVGWKNSYYRFRVTTTSGQETMVIVVDASRELSPSFNVLNASLAGGAAGILVSFLVLIPLSKILVKPTEESIRRQKRFVSDASHELKTPLTIISANNEINEAIYGENEQSKTITRQVKLLNSMVAELNALAKMDEGSEKIAMADFDLADILADLVPPFETKFRAKGINLTTDIDENIPFHGSEKLCRTLFANILENAYKYGLKEASFSCKKENGRITIKLKNDAEDIPDGDLDRVFERFYRSDAARASQTDGSGLGLAMAKEIVLAHKGRCFAYGKDGKFNIKITF